MKKWFTGMLFLVFVVNQAYGASTVSDTAMDWGGGALLAVGVTALIVGRRAKKFD